MAARSPNYPSCSLPTAVSLARSIWGKLGSSTATSEEIVKYFGYNGLNGVARTKLAALKAYGLLEGSAGGWKFSPRAIVILNSDGGDPNIGKAMHDAFSEVDLFRALIEKFPDASKGMITTYLMSDQSFTKDGAIAAAESFLESKAAVIAPDSPKLDEAKGIDESKGGMAVSQQPIKPPAQTPVTPLPKPMGVHMDELKIPCGNGASVTLHYPTTMSQADYDLVDTFLKAFWASKKSVLVKTEKPTEPLIE